METLTLNLPSEVYDKLQHAAHQAGEAVETLAAAWLSERARSAASNTDASSGTPSGERERARAVLQDAGLLTELGPELKQRAGQSTATLEEVQAAFGRAGGKPLSEIVSEMRGPKG